MRRNQLENIITDLIESSYEELQLCEDFSIVHQLP
jgi:hypothetical protein